MGSYEFTIYAPALKREVCIHQARIWGGSLRFNEAYFDWKHLRNPCWEEPSVYLALHHGEVVGLRAMFGICWEAGSDAGTCVLPSASDAGVAEGHRNGGLYRELSAFAMEDLRRRGFHHVLNFSATPANYVVSVMTMGWKPMGSAQELVLGGSGAATPQDAATSTRDALDWVLDAGRAAGRRAKRMLHIGAFGSLDRRTGGKAEPVEVSRLPRPEAMAALAAQAGDGRLRLARDPAYLVWRFRNPRFDYRFLFHGGKTLDGYLVLQNTVGRRQVNIVDWEAPDPAVRSGLLEAALSMGRFRTMATWGASLGTEELGSFRAAGFCPVEEAGGSAAGQGGRFLLKMLDPAGDRNILGRDPLDPSSWNFRMAVSDNA